MIIKNHQNFIWRSDWRELAYATHEDDWWYVKAWNGMAFIKQKASIEADAQDSFWFDPIKAYKIGQPLSYKNWQVYIGKTKITKGTYSDIANIKGKENEYHPVPDKLYDVLSRVKDVIPATAYSPILTTVNIQTKKWVMSITWTDGRVLKNYIIKDTQVPDCNFNMPWQTLQLILKTINNFDGATMSIGKNIFIKQDTIKLSTFTVDMKYPDCEPIINADFNKEWIIHNKELQDIATRASIVNIDTLYFENGRVRGESIEWAIDEPIKSTIECIVDPKILKHILTKDEKTRVVYNHKFMKLALWNYCVITIALMQ